MMTMCCVPFDSEDDRETMRRDFEREVYAKNSSDDEPSAGRETQALQPRVNPIEGAVLAAAPESDRLAHADEDGHCSICGLPWPDERETLEPHVCPPGFQRDRLVQCPVVWGPEKQDVPGGKIYRVGESTGVILPPQPESEEGK